MIDSLVYLNDYGVVLEDILKALLIQNDYLIQVIGYLHISLVVLCLFILIGIFYSLIKKFIV